MVSIWINVLTLGIGSCRLVPSYQGERGRGREGGGSNKVKQGAGGRGMAMQGIGSGGGGRYVSGDGSREGYYGGSQAMPG